jgi:hypothetical protein
MRRIATTLVLLSAIVLSAPARAAQHEPTAEQALQMARVTVVVPIEWDGTYTTLDTSYDCTGTFKSTSAGTDTICGGKDYSPNQAGSPITFDCTGTADASSFDMTCTGTYNPLADCIAHYNIVSHGTLSGGDYFIVSVINVTYTGTDPLCSYLMPSCTQYNSHGTRTGPAPGNYCTTPTRRTTWGAVKTFYR